MARPCTICQHANRAEIDKAIASGEPIRFVAKQFGIGAAAVQRHKATHITRAMAKAVATREAKVVRQSGELLDELDAIRAEAKRLGKLAEETGDLKTALMALREWARVEEIKAKVQGDIDEAPRVNVLVSHASEWAALRTVILGALDRHPEALADVVNAIKSYEARSAALPATA